MAHWRTLVLLGGIATAALGLVLLAVAPAEVVGHHAWRPGEPIAVTEATGERAWNWSFRIPGAQDGRTEASVRFLFNMTIVRGDDEGYWEFQTRLRVDGEQVDGLGYGSAAFDPPGDWERNVLTARWTMEPGREHIVEARMTNVPTSIPGRDWEVEYDPMLFEVTTRTERLDWALAGPGAGLLLAGFASVGSATMPRRPDA